MSCEFCKNEKILIQTNVLSDHVFAFNDTASREDAEAFTYPLGVFIDTRGYLRLVDLEDCNCLEPGEKIAINFCPLCGDVVKQGC